MALAWDISLHMNWPLSNHPFIQMNPVPEIYQSVIWCSPHFPGCFCLEDVPFHYANLQGLSWCFFPLGFFDLLSCNCFLLLALSFYWSVYLLEPLILYFTYLLHASFLHTLSSLWAHSSSCFVLFFKYCHLTQNVATANTHYSLVHQIK